MDRSCREVAPPQSTADIERVKPGTRIMVRKRAKKNANPMKYVRRERREQEQSDVELKKRCVFFPPLSMSVRTRKEASVRCA